MIYATLLAASILGRGPIEEAVLQSLGPTVKFTVPAGQPIFEEHAGPSVKVTTKSGYSYFSYTTVLKPGGKQLGQVVFKMALPKGKTVKEVDRVVLTIPPGGSAPIVAPGACAERGYGSVSIQSAQGGRDPQLLASQGIAVANHLLEQNPRLTFVFAGFSMGGFGAQSLAFHLLDRCAGLLLIGNYYLNPPLPNKLPIVMLLGKGDGPHLSLAEKALAEQTDIGMNIRLMMMPGGHGYGTTKDQDRALRALFE